MVGLNRTSVGLKQAVREALARLAAGLNRTSVGLKQSMFCWTSGRESPPQSNQRGIETVVEGVKRVGPRRSGLNRTSVGLKLDLGGPDQAHQQLRLNRTSVGLKRWSSSSTSPLPTGLNRTSVGLKLRSNQPTTLGGPKPQSNQRGIETELWKSVIQPHLKPQSNQRGIETRRHNNRNGEHHIASIEPAWD